MRSRRFRPMIELQYQQWKNASVVRPAILSAARLAVAMWLVFTLPQLVAVEMISTDATPDQEGWRSVGSATLFTACVSLAVPWIYYGLLSAAPAFMALHADTMWIAAGCWLVLHAVLGHPGRLARFIGADPSFRANLTRALMLANEAADWRCRGYVLSSEGLDAATFPGAAEHEAVSRLCAFRGGEWGPALYLFVAFVFISLCAHPFARSFEPRRLPNHGTSGAPAVVKVPGECSEESAARPPPTRAAHARAPAPLVCRLAGLAAWLTSCT